MLAKLERCGVCHRPAVPGLWRSRTGKALHPLCADIDRSTIVNGPALDPNEIAALLGAKNGHIADIHRPENMERQSTFYFAPGAGGSITHVWAVCAVCREGRMVRKGSKGKCILTYGCPGKMTYPPDLPRAKSWKQHFGTSA